MNPLFWIAIPGLFILALILAVLHKGLLSEYQMMSRFPLPSDFELAVKIIHGIFIYFYLVIIISIFLLTKYAIS